MTDKAMEAIDDVDLDTNADLDDGDSNNDGDPTAWKPSTALPAGARAFQIRFSGGRVLLELRCQKILNTMKARETAKQEGIVPFVESVGGELQETAAFHELARRHAEYETLTADVRGELAAAAERLRELRAERASLDGLDLRPRVQRARQINTEIASLERSRESKQAEVMDAKAILDAAREAVDAELGVIVLSQRDRHLGELRAARERAFTDFLARHANELNALTMAAFSYSEALGTQVLESSVGRLVDTLLRSAAPAEPLAAAAG